MELARAAFKTLRRWLEPDKRQKTVGLIGGFSGWGGIFYTLTHLSVLWDEPDLLSEADAMVSVLPERLTLFRAALIAVWHLNTRFPRARRRYVKR